MPEAFPERSSVHRTTTLAGQNYIRIFQDGMGNEQRNPISFKSTMRQLPKLALGSHFLFSGLVCAAKLSRHTFCVT